MPACYRSAPLSHATHVERQPRSDQHQQSYQSVSGHDDSWCSSTSASDDDDDLMTSTSPSHVTVMASSPPPRQLSVSELFTYQHPQQLSQSHHYRLSHVPANYTVLSYCPEPEIQSAEERWYRGRRLPVASASSFEDSAVDNLSAPSTSSAGSRGRIDQLRLSDSSVESHGCNGAMTHTVAVISCSPGGDVGHRPVTSQAVVAVPR